MKVQGILFSLVLSTSTGLSQSGRQWNNGDGTIVGSPALAESQLTLRVLKGVKTKSTDDLGILGSPYYSNEWVAGDVNLREDNGTYHSNHIKINFYLHLLEFNINGITKVLDFDKVDYLKLQTGAGVEEFRCYTRDHQVNLYKVLIKDCLYKLHSVELQESTFNPALNIGEPNDRFIQVETYFLLTETGLVELSKNTRSLANILHVDVKSLRAKLREEENELTSEEDYISLVLWARDR